MEVTPPPKRPFLACDGCPRQCGTEEFPRGYVVSDLFDECDLLVVLEAPVNDRWKKAPRPFDDDAGRIIRATVKLLQAQNALLRVLRVRYAYVVRCASNQGEKDANKVTLEKCGSVLKEQLLAAHPGKKPMLLLLGKPAATAFGIKIKKLKDSLGRAVKSWAHIDTGGQRVELDALVTLSTKQVVTQSGAWLTFSRDVLRALEFAAGLTSGVAATPPTLEELTASYVFPKTPEEVRQLVDDVIAYSENGVAPEKWPIALDTETNTLQPYRDTLKLLCISVAWGEGKAGAIALQHFETPYAWESVLGDVKRLLECAKPKYFHNYKYDWKVFKRAGLEVRNVVWDSMTGEHVLEEDKKGFYSLKPLTRAFFPEFAGYADALQEMLEKDSTEV